MPELGLPETIGLVCDQTVSEGLRFDQLANGSIETRLSDGARSWPVNPRYVGLFIDAETQAHPYVGDRQVEIFHADYGIDASSLHTDILEWGFQQLVRWLPKRFLVIDEQVEDRAQASKGISLNMLPRVMNIARQAIEGPERPPHRMLDYPAPFELTPGQKRRLGDFFEAVLSKPEPVKLSYQERRYWPPA